MPVFPSVEWFEAVKEVVNRDGAYRSLGTVDASVGVKIGDRAFVVAFEAFECASVEEADDDGLHDVDFYLQMAPEEWSDLIRNIRSNSGADASHTLNYLDLASEQGIVRSRDEFRRTAFLRFHLSLQSFFDASATIETTFAA